jgi:hypothetical protein
MPSVTVKISPTALELDFSQPFETELEYIERTSSPAENVTFLPRLVRF